MPSEDVERHAGGESHRLCLPLPAGYRASSLGEFAAFDSTPHSSRRDADEASVLHSPEVLRYLHDLVSFLRAHRLVQYHPENYFRYLSRGGQPDDDHVQRHLDGTPITWSEKEQLAALCAPFGEWLHSTHQEGQTGSSGERAQGDQDETCASVALDQLAELVRCGPPVSARSTAVNSDVAAVCDFYDTTKRLMLGRKRRPSADYCRLTFASQTTTAGDAAVVTEGERLAGDDESWLTVIGSQNMCEKKRHEVTVMRSCLIDMMQQSLPGLQVGRDASSQCQCHSQCQAPNPNPSPCPCQGPSGSCGCCNACSCSPPRSASPLPFPSKLSPPLAGATLLNVGEGKGYCSRVLALKDAVQVIGLDCNPLHKEGFAGRLDKLVDGRSLNSASDGSDGAMGMNMRYRPRGHMVSVTCRVDSSTDWREVLMRHVAVRDESTGVVSTPPSWGVLPETDAVDEHAAGAGVDHTATSSVSKVQCIVCRHITRPQSHSGILKHAKQHMDASRLRGGTTLTHFGSGKPIPFQLDAYEVALRDLPQEEFVRTVLKNLFTSDVDFGSGGSAEKDSAPKRPRSPDTSASENTIVGSAPTHQQDPPNVRRCSRVLPRGMRVEGLWRIQAHIDACSGGTGTDSRQGRQLVDVWVRMGATITGYDEGCRRHKVVLDRMPDGLLESAVRRANSVAHEVAVKILNPDNLLRPFMCELWEGAKGSQTLADDDSALATIPCCKRPSSTGCVGAALLLRSVPFVEPLRPPVGVPSLSNVAMMGLHTCGDLGSNILRLFTAATCRSPCLLLVSCCWHALTPHGFPLSQAVRDLGVRTDHISLMLATQPLDMWASGSSEGHRGSARLLFFRGLLPLLWEDAHAEFRRRRAAMPAERSCTCSVACGGQRWSMLLPPPHLEPSFLRRMAKIKSTVTLSEFVAAAFVEYYSSAERRRRFLPWAQKQLRETIRRGSDEPQIGGNAPSVAQPSTRREGGEEVQEPCAVCSAVFTEVFVDNVTSSSETPSAFLRDAGSAMEARYVQRHFKPFLGLTVLRMWMSHLIETLLLLDRTLFLHEQLSREPGSNGSDVTLAPIFDGALSPRMYGIFARRRSPAQL